MAEVLIVLAIVSLVATLAAARTLGWNDRLAVRRAAAEVWSFYGRARYGAVLGTAQVRIEVSGDSLRAVYEGAADSVFLAQPGPSRHGVELTASRPVLRVAANGFGRGASNTKLILRRGEAAESLTVSRLGRMKRWR
jgi:Tfp pilus assembly protein FimT